MRPRAQREEDERCLHQDKLLHFSQCEPEEQQLRAHGALCPASKGYNTGQERSKQTCIRHGHELNLGLRAEVIKEMRGDARPRCLRRAATGAGQEQRKFGAQRRHSGSTMTPLLSCAAPLILLLLAAVRLSNTSNFPDPQEANQFLSRHRRANQVFEETKQGHLERECVEERCSKEEAREVFENDPETEYFWPKYTACLDKFGDSEKKKQDLITCVHSKF
ncbi:hypothetical protein WMY93_019164 [Mugilogobius chulae]|uniref:Gla domain-containing protein n=1 Tax=Mugilogobius chulae TaxID=88201 RepID=A0AAW0NKD5_9GOBI